MPRTLVFLIAFALSLSGARAQGAGPALGGLAIAPAAGSVTNGRVAQISGSVTGAAAPFTVTFLVEGAVESQISGLAAGEAFRHGITLVNDGQKRFTVRARDAAGAQVQEDLGTLTLDTTGPAAPVLLTPVPIVSNQNTITLKGIHPEPPRPGSTGPSPKVLVLGPGPVRFTPAQPQVITDPNGRFETQADVSSLPDGTYSFRLIAIDAAGNFSESQPLQFKR